MNHAETPSFSDQKILALDPGDQWVGTALSDILGFTAKPLETVPISNLIEWLGKIIAKHSLQHIVIGYPLTLRGTQSEQTKKVIALKQSLETSFPKIQWHLWDERLTSKQAEKLKHATTKEEKLLAHSVAAAFILQSYLDYLYHKKALENK
jgi:putative Holliday junction resolvase